MKKEGKSNIKMKTHTHTHIQKKNSKIKARVRKRETRKIGPKNRRNRGWQLKHKKRDQKLKQTNVGGEAGGGRSKQ